MKKGDLLLGIICILLGAFTIIMSDNFPNEASDFPRLVSTIIIILGIMLLIQYFRHIAGNTNKNEEKINVSKLIKVIMLSCLFIAYYLFVEALGYIIPTFLIVFLTIILLEYKNIKVNLILSATLSVFLYLVFTFLFQVNLPQGLFY